MHSNRVVFEAPSLTGRDTTDGGTDWLLPSRLSFAGGSEGFSGPETAAPDLLEKTVLLGRLSFVTRPIGPAVAESAGPDAAEDMVTCMME